MEYIAEEVSMKLKIEIYEFSNHKYGSLFELAQTMGISISQIYRVRQGKRSIDQNSLSGQ